MNQIPLVADRRNAIVSTVLFAVLCGACLTPFSLWSLMLLYLVGCCALCTVTLTAGWMPALLGLVLSSGGMGLLFGAGGAACALAYLAPTWILFLILYKRKTPWLYACAALIGCQIISQAAIFLTLNHLAGGDLFARAAQAVTSFVENSSFGDMLLISMANYGLVGLSGEMVQGAVVVDEMGYVLSDPARQELLLSLRALVGDLLSALLPGMLISHSIETGLLCHTWPRHRLRRRDVTVENPDDVPEQTADAMPHLSRWHIPRPWGLRIGVLGLGYFLSSAQQPALAMLGQLFFALFSTAFTVQGLATLNFVQHKRGTGYSWRVGLPIVLTFLLPNTLLFLGLMDQVTNMRALRPLRRPPEDGDNPFDPDINP